MIFSLALKNLAFNLFDFKLISLKKQKSLSASLSCLAMAISMKITKIAPNWKTSSTRKSLNIFTFHARYNNSGTLVYLHVIFDFFRIMSSEWQDRFFKKSSVYRACTIYRVLFDHRSNSDQPSLEWRWLIPRYLWQSKVSVWGKNVMARGREISCP